jgi:hypothetical protein
MQKYTKIKKKKIEPVAGVNGIADNNFYFFQ